MGGVNCSKQLTQLKVKKATDVRLKLTYSANFKKEKIMDEKSKLTRMNCVGSKLDFSLRAKIAVAVAATSLSLVAVGNHSA
jgi:hypothetical protein